MAAEQNIDVYVQEKFFPVGRFSRFLPNLRKRTIIEVGAARPDFLSISASFRAKGWKVVSIEPNPAFCAAHEALGYRVLRYACGEENRDGVDFFVVDSLGADYMDGKVSGESFSSLGIAGRFAELHETVRGKTTTHVIKVDVRKLDTILAEHEPQLSRVDVLAVDVEGWELNVMRGFSLEKYNPKVVILENNFDEAECKAHMAGRGYAFHAHLAPNDIFLRVGA